MIDLYTWATPNGWKISILLEELGLPYRVFAIDVDSGAQFDPAFRRISPNHKTPAIVDHDCGAASPLAIFETGAIMIHLAEKTGSPLLPQATPDRQIVLQWLMFQVAGVGPMFSQAHHFLRYASEDVPYARQRYLGQVRRHYDVMERRLSEAKYLGGIAYSIADIATLPWIVRHRWHGVTLGDYPGVQRWYTQVTARAAVGRGLGVPAPASESQPTGTPSPVHAGP